MEISQRYLDQLKAVTRNENQDAIQVMIKHGTKRVTPSKDQIDEFKKLSDQAMSRMSSQSFSQKVFNEVSSTLELHRREGK